MNASEALSLVEKLLDSENTESSLGETSLFQVGRNVFIRTVTHYFTGRVIDTKEGFVILDSPASIPSTGRLYDAIRDCKFDEVEPLPGPHMVNISSITDFCYLAGILPTEQK